MGLTLCFWAASISPFFLLFYFIFILLFFTVLPPTHLVMTVAASGHANRRPEQFLMTQ